jgi:hypothetical protein
MSLLLKQTRELSFETPGGQLLEFRVEVFERSNAEAVENQFRVRVWIYELVRLSSPFSKQAEGDYFDATLLVLSDLFDGFEYTAGTPDEAAEACIAKMKEHLTMVR